MKKRMILAAAIAAVILACSAIPQVLAYFTDFTKAKGQAKISIGSKTTIEEDVDLEKWEKSLVITNEGPDDCWVRARAYAGTEVQAGIKYTSDGSWKDGGDGWWYYDTPVAAGENTTELLVQITDVPEDEAEFNVAVTYQSVQTLYDGETALPADWSMKAEGGQG